MRHMRHLSATLVAALFPLLAYGAADKGIKVRGEQVPPGDIAALPPVCRLLLENEGIHHSTGQKRNAALFERPEYHMAKGNGHLHHYCWALISKQRYFRESQKTKREFYFDRYLGDINYVFEHSAKNWGYFDVLHLELASMYVIRGDFAKAINHADQALASKPGAEKAYVVKADAYKQMGKKELAVETALEGLNKNPHSKVLRSRLTKLGVKPPEAKDIAAPTPTAPPSEPAAAAAATPVSGSTPDAASPAPTAATPAAGAATEGTDPAAGTAAAATDAADATATADAPKPNPYCRFCP